MAQQLRNPTGIHKDMGLISCLARLVKDPALLWAVVWVADVAQIPHCCGCNVGWCLSSIGPLAWEPPYAMGCGPKKTRKKKKDKYFVVPVMAQQKRIQLGTMRLWVRSLALLSGLRSKVWVAEAAQIWHCCDRGVGQRLQL